MGGRGRKGGEEGDREVRGEMGKEG